MVCGGVQATGFGGAVKTHGDRSSRRRAEGGDDDDDDDENDYNLPKDPASLPGNRPIKVCVPSRQMHGHSLLGFPLETH